MHITRLVKHNHKPKRADAKSQYVAGSIQPVLCANTLVLVFSNCLMLRSLSCIIIIFWVSQAREMCHTTSLHTGALSITKCH